MKIGRRPFLLGSVLVGCGSVAPEPTPAPAISPSVPPPDPPLPGPTSVDTEPLSGPSECIDKNPRATNAALVGLVHSFPRFGRLYSYTTPEQVAELRAGTQPIFSRAVNSANQRGFLFDVLEDERRFEAVGAELAAVLLGGRFAKGRFAWPFLAGTRPSPEKYGDEILAFDLRPEAYVVAFARSGVAPMACYDGTFAPVRLEDVLAAPERIGAIVFLNDGNFTPGTFFSGDAICNPSGGLLYREIYLCNEAMLAGWSLGTQAIVDRIAAESAELRLLARELDCTRGRIAAKCDPMLLLWRRGPLKTRIDELVASMAFNTFFGNSGADTAALVRLADDLDTLKFAPNPLVRP